MKLLDLTVLGLAAARLTQLVVEDEITRPIREAVQRRSIKEFQPVRDGRLVVEPLGKHEIPQPVQPWDAIDTLINCPACTSVWTGAGVLTAEQAGPVGRFLVRVLALSQAALAVQAVIERIER